MEQELEKLRAQIDAVDDELMALLRKRAALAGDAGEIKRRRQSTVFARLERQADILRRLAPTGGLLADSSVRAIYREIISACLAVEKPPTIAYLGPPHTFTHDAARKYFGDSAGYQSVSGIRATIELAEKKGCDFAVAPFENSSEGTVGETIDALLATSLSINGEIMLRVRHNLLAAAPCELTEVETVYAHPQALAQCRLWLKQHVPQALTAAVESNAAAAKQIAAADAGKVAAIASHSAAAHYQLTKLATDIEDSTFNTTRFLILGESPPLPSAVDKTSFFMTARSKSGALYHLLEPLTRLGINMTKFESRPAHGQLWEYVFFVDIDGHQQTPVVAQALAEMRERAAFLKVLGSYPKAEA